MSFFALSRQCVRVYGYIQLKLRTSPRNLFSDAGFLQAKKWSKNKFLWLSSAMQILLVFVISCMHFKNKAFCILGTFQKQLSVSLDE